MQKNIKIIKSVIVTFSSAALFDIFKRKSIQRNLKFFASLVLLHTYSNLNYVMHFMKIFQNEFRVCVCV